jgi:rhodanese-related sulfurtransferase
MVQTLTAHEAAALLSSQHVDVVDVRDEREWITGHLAGSRLVPLDQLRADPDAALSRDSIILFVCAKGVRSLTAAKLAERLGYTKVYNLEGGTTQWSRAGLSLVTEQRVAA